MRRPIIFYLMLFLLTACTAAPTGQAPSATVPTPSTAPVQSQPAPEPSATPSPTPPPAALRVNGEAVPQAEYDASLAQLTAAQPGLDPAAAKQKVLGELVDQTLLAQGAAESGFTLDDADLQKRIDDLTVQMGDPQALIDWQMKMGYTPESFLSAFRRAEAAAWMRDQILASIPAEMEQIRARQILLRTEEGARQAEQQAKAPGTNFATLAAGYDLVTRGDLYWFPRGYLDQPAVEEAAFALQPGEISAVIKSEIGYHILQVVAREVRPLSPDARAVLRRKALAAWLQERRQGAQIDVLIP